MERPVKVGIVLGSDSDLDVMLEAVKVLDALEVGCEVIVSSAHRTPKRTEEYASSAAGRGLGVLIGAAGGAAALPGVLAASSPLPVIGVPIASTPLGGADGPAGTATFQQLGAQAARIQVTADRSALVLVRIPFDPGWHARLDGREVPVIPADYLDQGVLVPPGRHVLSLEPRRTPCEWIEEMIRRCSALLE